MEAVPLTLGYCYTSLARGDDARWIRNRFHVCCGEMGTGVVDRDGRLVFDW